jgi:serine/threonine-protein kinase RsbT
VAPLGPGGPAGPRCQWPGGAGAPAVPLRRLGVAEPADVGRARRAVRALAAALGFGLEDTEAVALAVTELATNLVRYARLGEIALSRVECPDAARGPGVQVESRDAGPGIADAARAMEDGFSTGGGLGSGLPAVRRLMDDFALTTDAAGTRIVARKWPSRSRPR